MTVSIKGVPRTSNQAKRFFDEAQPRGPIFTQLRKHAKNIHVYFEHVSQRIRDLAEIASDIDKVEEARLFTLARELDAKLKPLPPAFKRDVQTVKSMLDKYPSEKAYVKFITDDVVYTSDVIDYMLKSTTWISDIKLIVPDDVNAMQHSAKQIKELSESFDKTRGDQRMFDRLLSGRASEARTDIGEAIKKAKEMIKEDLDVLKDHRIAMNRLMFLYQTMGDAYIKICEAEFKKINEIKHDFLRA